MSLAYHVAGDAGVRLRRLSFDAQEAVYDALDDLTEGGEPLPEDEIFAQLIYLNVDDAMHTLTLTLRVSGRTGLLTLLDVDDD